MDGSSSSALVENPTRIGQIYKAAYDKMMGNTTQCAKVINLFGNGILLAVLVLGCVGAANVLSGPVMGWAIVGLGGGYMGIKLLAGNLKERIVDLISSAVIASVIITFGALGCAGVLTNAQMGYALLGSIVITACVSSYMMICAKRKYDNKTWMEV